MTDEKHRLLKKYWGYDAFRPLQEEIVDSVMQGHDTLALLPTGGGKSLCYQLPALLREGVCLVVSPLIALMKDQVQQLNDRHIKAACLVSGMSRLVLNNVLYNAISGDLKLLYVSPERLRQRLFIEHLRRMRVSLIAVDEAHCVSQWGYDFRPPYLEIAAIRAYHPSAPLLALTATATPAVADDICHHLQMHQCRRFQSSFMRSNLAYRVVRDADKSRRLLRIIRQVGGSGIVYTRSRRGTQSLARFLAENGVSATYYHAGLDTRERDARQAQWMDGTSQVMVATNAFGMGIDKPDVRFVVHMDIPESLEAYFQEAGRAGRDGQPSLAALLCYPDADIALLRKGHAADFPPVQHIRNVYRALCNHYKIPVGSGSGSSFDFDIEVLCHTYSFSPREFYSACRFLEREGLIALPEHEDAASSLYIPLSRSEVYRVEVSHQRLGGLLQLLMRLYPGLFTEPVAIDEDRIANRFGANASDVRAMLKQLDDMKVVEYRPRPKKPQVIFASSRVDEREILLSDKDYQQVKEAALRRLEAMQAYVTSDAPCRSRQLLAYFGEQASADCGQCDVCQKHRADGDAVRQAVLDALKASPLSVPDLCAMLEDRGLADVPDRLRDMLDRGLLTLDPDLRLHLV